MPALLIALALRWNWLRHLDDKSTVCAWLRKLPWPVLRPGLAVFFAWLWIHLRNGYDQHGHKR